MSDWGRQGRLAAPIVVGGLAAAGIGVVGPAIVGAALFGMLGLVALVQYSSVRLAWYVAGGMIVFQSTIGPAKYAYLAGVAVLTVIGALRLSRSDAEWLPLFSPVLRLIPVGILVLAGSALVGASNGATASLWFRDAAPYVLLLCAPVVALDAGHDLTLKHAERLILVCAVAGSIGFTSDWLDRRHMSGLPFGRILLATGALAVAGMALALTRALLGKGLRRVGWLLLGCGIPGLMLTTGNRTLLVFVAVLPGLVALRGPNRVSVFKVIGLTAVAGGVLFTAVPWLVSLVSSDPAAFEQRARMAKAVLAGDASADASYQTRHQAYSLLSQAFHEHPWFGWGPGGVNAEIALDSPLTTAVRFGIIGTTVFVALLLAMAWCGRRAARRYGQQPIHIAGRGFLFVMVATAPFAAALEDKGLPLAIALVLTAVVSAAQRTSGERPAEDVATRAPGRELIKLPSR